MRGQDLFRSAVIEALGDYNAAYALGADSWMSRSSTGRSRTTRCWRLGKIGDKRALEMLAGAAADGAARPSAVDRGGDLPARHQLRVASEVRRRHADVRDREPGLPGSAAGRRRARLAALAAAGREDAAATLVDARRARRGSGALADRAGVRHGRAAQHAACAEGSRRRGRIRSETALLLRDAFDMLEEDFEEERFFATVRRTLLAGARRARRRARSPTR